MAEFPDFRTYNEAQAFSDLIKKIAGIDSVIKDRGNIAMYHDTLGYDFAVNINGASAKFTARLIYSIYCTHNIEVNSLPSLSRRKRLKVLEDQLLFKAICEDKKWSLSEISNAVKWYQEKSKLTDSEIRKALHETKEKYYKTISRESKLSFLIGVVLFGLTLIFVYFGGVFHLAPMLSFASVVIFFIFSAIKKYQH